MMTRAGYEKLAQAFNDSWPEPIYDYAYDGTPLEPTLSQVHFYNHRKDAWRVVREHVMVALEADNPRFSREKFIDATGGE